MLSLNRKTDYALVALAGLCAADQRLSARDLAGRLQLPLPVLRNILKVLTQRGVLRSEQGSRGGYRLAGSTFGNLSWRLLLRYICLSPRLVQQKRH